MLHLIIPFIFLLTPTGKICFWNPERAWGALVYLFCFFFGFFSASPTLKKHPYFSLGSLLSTGGASRGAKGRLWLVPYFVQKQTSKP